MASLIIAVDAMGGDNAPLAPVKGALLSREKHPGTELVLVGREDAVRGALREAGYSEPPAGITIKNASEVIEIADDPATAFRKKPDSSMTVGLNMVRSGEADGFVSAGSTGALLAG
ncbi:MAG: phosphate--acyl-ACP acyltransferase, partial [Oscillospiraceae bacterium]|nr:phosphate--acyl-ACP acyltransferase [Oscillospiraceae bacterium]